MAVSQSPPTTVSGKVLQAGGLTDERKKRNSILILEVQIHDSCWWQPVIQISYDLNDSWYLLQNIVPPEAEF